MPKFTVYGKFLGQPATCVYDNGKVTSDPPEIAEKVIEFINIIRTWEMPYPADGCALYYLWKETADEPLAHLCVMEWVMEIERKEGEVPSELFIYGATPEQRERLEKSGFVI